MGGRKAASRRRPSCHAGQGVGEVDCAIDPLLDLGSTSQGEVGAPARSPAIICTWPVTPYAGRRDASGKPTR